MVFIDTNIWLYLSNPDSPYHLKTKKNLAEFINGSKSFVVTWQIFYEFIRCATDLRIYSRPVSWKEAYAFIEMIFAYPTIRILHEGVAHHEALRFVMEKSGFSKGSFSAESSTSATTASRPPA